MGNKSEENMRFVKYIKRTFSIPYFFIENASESYQFTQVKEFN